MTKLALTLCAAAVAVGVNQAQSCCTTNDDCAALLTTADEVYNAPYGKILECDQNCPGLINCNMFGLCEQCRGCFNTCEGAFTYISDTDAAEETMNFCVGAEAGSVAECVAMASGSGEASDVEPTSSPTSSPTPLVGGSGSGSGSGVSGSGGEYGSGMGSGSGSIGGEYGSGMGSGSGSMGSEYGSGMGSGSGSIGGGSGSGMGSGSGSQGGASSSASASAGRMADIPGCTCNSPDLPVADAFSLCQNGKSVYCDEECLPESDIESLFVDMRGLWCQPTMTQGCRLCKFDCSEYDGDFCVECPPQAQDFC